MKTQVCCDDCWFKGEVFYGYRVDHFIGSAQFLFLCNRKKSGATWVYTTFPRIIKKIPATSTFYWLELITVALNFLKILNLEKKFTCFLFFFSKFKKILRENQIIKVVFRNNCLFSWNQFRSFCLIQVVE